MEKQRITPEVAYVKSEQIIAKAYGDIELGREKMHFYQKVSIFSSIAIGLLSSLIHENPAAFIVPVVMLNGAILPLTAKILSVLRDCIKENDEDKAKLESGAIDPRDYYERIEKFYVDKGKSHIVDSLSDDTSRLSDQEREMLSKFSDESPRIK